MGSIREPIKKSSIAKKQKIIEKGFGLICDKGYHNVTCADIAKYASISTGSIYQYFENKKDIFKDGIKNYSKQILYPFLELTNTKLDLENIDSVIENVIRKTIENHTVSKKSHEEIMAMVHQDDEVAEIFRNIELDITNKIVEYLDTKGLKLDNAKEKVHIMIGLIDNLSHEVVYHKHNNLNNEMMIHENVKLIRNILLG